MTRPRILLTNPIEAQALARLQAVADVRLAPATDLGTLRDAARDAHAIIVRAPLPADVFDHAPGVLVAVRHGAGVDMIPVDEATAAGVVVANAPGANATTVAEYAIAQMLRLARRLDRIDADLRTAGWAAARAQADAGRDLAGSTLGIVGAGAIGSALARIAGAGLGMQVLGHRRRPELLAPTMQWAPLDALLAASDWVVLTCPLTSETRGLIDARRIAAMKPGAVLVNVSRGAVVDESALVAALADGRLGGAVLDVFETQPLPPSSPLYGFDHVLLSPHMAGIDADSMRRMSALAVDQTLAVLAGQRPAHLVNPPVWAHRRPNPFAPHVAAGDPS